MAILGPQRKAQLISDRLVVTPIWQLEQGFSLGKRREAIGAAASWASVSSCPGNTLWLLKDLSVIVLRSRPVAPAGGSDGPPVTSAKWVETRLLTEMAPFPKLSAKVGRCILPSRGLHLGTAV